MGLDAWLNISKYVYGDEDKDELRKLVASYLLKGNQILKDMKDYELKEVKFEVGYWRKANHIHNWFVINVQEGEDDCGYYDVGEEKLKELLKIINQILNEKDKEKQVKLAEELLPRQSGFFFGETDYDTYYFEDLEKTKKIIEKLLKIKNLDEYNITYTSSW